MLDWADQFNILLFLDSNQYPSQYEGYECLVAVGAEGNDLTAQSLAEVQQLHDTQRDWLFGHISYDYKNVTEPALRSAHPEKTGFPLIHFFVPTTVCHINRQQTTLTIESMEDPELVHDHIMNYAAAEVAPLPELEFERVIGRESYIDTVNQLREHITEGDCYEINFCTEGFCAGVDVKPLDVYKALNGLSPAPFSAYYRLADSYMACASPERYLRNDGTTILSQPIKGTARRGKDAEEDERIKIALRQDLKEQAENVMIVDLVRNDLARCCIPGSVAVDELFGIYTFPQVHQMISTVHGELRADVPFTDAIRHSFPMGSMTGAPKYKVMQLIEHYERARRGLYSGTVGYITPAGDFDFNVVIRSLFYNAATRYLSYQTGGAITYDSDPAREWDEMRLKAWALERVFK